MTLKTWKDEFYTEDAAVFADATSADKASGAVEHSLKKWAGLRPENLAKHGLVRYEDYIVSPENVKKFYDASLSEDEFFEISGESCALCQMFGYCTICPLWKVRGEVACDSQMYAELVSPYDAFTKNSDPEPMIMWLKKAKDAS